MFIRLVVPVKHVDSHRLTGIFQAVGRLRDGNALSTRERERLDALVAWFDEYLPYPRWLAPSPLRTSREPLFWFKAAASPHVSRVRELAALLERAGKPTRLLRTRRPGPLVYEDAYQVAAVPFRDTRA